MSLFSDYIEEIDCGRKIIELPGVAFATYFIHKEIGECYIEDLYIAPDFRCNGYLTKIMNSITEIAKFHGCKVVTHGIVKTHKNKDSVQEISARLFGFKKHSETDTDINFIKEIA